MNELSDKFKSLPVEYQEVISLTQNTNNIRVTPLMELKGGQTGAYLYLVSVSLPESPNVKHLILKLDHKNKKAKMDEIERHSTAVNQASPEFARDHIADLAFDRIEKDGTVAIFYSIAGQSLHHFRSLASYQQQSKLEKIFKVTSKLLLVEWNAAPKFEQAVHPQTLLTRWLGYRLQLQGNIENFLENVCHIPQSITGLIMNGQVFPNPLTYARNNNLWGKARPIDTIIGFQHGDLNIGNILVRFSEDETELTGCYLIDFALFKMQTPLFYDNLYLEMSYLIRELTRIDFSKWIDFVTRFAEKDILDPLQVPIELTGACSVINAGRNTFSNWVQEFYPSLSDDLWGQFWLAGVAAGLNYCNKASLTKKERLAGLIFAAAHMKRFHTIFGLELPIEVRHIDIVRLSDESKLIAQVPDISGTALLKNFPVQTTPFIGRQKEITTTRELLHREDIRMLTLTGPGGTGKTRLALTIVSEMKNGFADGIYFVDIASIREPELVLTAIARITGLRDTNDGSLINELKKQLRDKKLLLLIDNFEQVTTAAPLLVELLQVCPNLKFLVTSREALHVRGEHVYPVPPLSLPGENLKGKSVEQVTQYESVQLFIERALAVKPDFEVTNENASAVAGICSKLDGLPLAIELAAARIILFSPHTLFDRIDNRLKILKGGARDLPVRQQTLRDTISWSYELLDIGEQRLFALLSIFPDCTFNAVESITGGIKQIDETGIDILTGLSSLINKSLVRLTDQSSGEPRLKMLETIREYALEQLEEDREFSSAVHKSHADYFTEFTQHQYRRLLNIEPEKILKEIDPDIENMRIAWRFWVTRGDLGQLQKLTDFLWLIYDAKGWYYETISLTTDLLNLLDSVQSTPEISKQQIMLQMSLARVLLSIKGYTPEVEEAYKKALELCNIYGEIPQMYPVLRTLASFYTYISEFKKSNQMGDQILNLSDSLKDTNMQVEGYLLKGYSLTFLGNLKPGLEYLRKGISLYNPEKYTTRSLRFGINPGVTCYNTSALCLWMLGYLDQSLENAGKALALANKLDHPFSLAYAFFHKGLLHLFRLEAESANEMARVVIEIAEKYEFHIWKAVATCLFGASLSGMKQSEDGLKEIKRGMEMYTELKTPPVFWPMLLVLQAGSLILAGQLRNALNIVNEALDILKKETSNPLLPELFRLKGDILCIVSPDNTIEAESLFTGALEMAKKQESLIFELRAAMSLNRLWKLKGKKSEGSIILQNTYNKFTEGFKTVDLQIARDLLELL